MADYLSLDTYAQFLTSAKALSTDTECIVFSERRYRIKGVDLDASHRHHRICTKHGLLEATEIRGEIEYRLTPKGMAVYDQYVIYRENRKG